jgi:hypothetical protein
MDGYGIMVTTKSITLEWDPPPLHFSYSDLAVNRYSVFYRSHGAQSWEFVGSVPASENPSIVLHHSDFGNGCYEFAVQAYSDIGGGSPLHTSLDATAQPFGGWFLKWERSD